jgi:hypothetical protein
MDNIFTKAAVGEITKDIMEKIMALDSVKEHERTPDKFASYFFITSRRKRSQLKTAHVLAQHHITTFAPSAVALIRPNDPKPIITTHHAITALDSTSGIDRSQPRKLGRKALAPCAASACWSSRLSLLLSPCNVVVGVVVDV